MDCLDVKSWSGGQEFTEVDGGDDGSGVAVMVVEECRGVRRREDGFAVVAASGHHLA